MHSKQSIHSPKKNITIRKPKNEDIEIIYNSTKLDKSGEKRRYHGLKSRSIEEIVGSMENLRKDDKRYQYLINHGYNGNQDSYFSEFEIINDIRYPIVHHFKTTYGNLPYHIAEVNAKSSIHERAMLRQHWYDIPHLKNITLDNSKTLEELTKLRHSVDPMDYVVLEYTGSESSNVLVWVLQALAPNIRKSVIIVGKDSYLEDLETIVDQFLQSNKVFQVSKNILPPTKRSEKTYVTLLKLDKHRHDSPIYLLFSYLDKLNWQLEPINVLFNDDSINYIESCEDQKYLVYKIVGTFEENLLGISHAISKSIQIDRVLLLDTFDFSNDLNWNLFLRYSSCSHKVYLPDLNSNNTMIYGQGQTIDEYQFIYYHQGLEKKAINFKPIYEKFGFLNYFEFEGALLDWMFRFRQTGRTGYRSASYSMYNENQSRYYNPHQCISLNIDSISNVDLYLNYLMRVHSKEEFNSISNVVLVTKSNEIIDNIDKYQHLTGLEFNYLNYTRKAFSEYTSDEERITQTLIMFTEILESAHCEIMVGSTKSKLDKFILQTSITKFNRPIFLYSIDGSTLK